MSSETESTSHAPANQTPATEAEGNPSLPDPTDAPRTPRRSLPTILPEPAISLQTPQQPQRDSQQQQQQEQQERNEEPPQVLQQRGQRHPQPSAEERAVFVIPNCPPTCVPENPGSCPQILVLPFLPTASTRNSQGLKHDYTHPAFK